MKNPPRGAGEPACAPPSPDIFALARKLVAEIAAAEARGDLQAPEAAARQLIATAPTVPDGHCLLATLCDDTGRLSEAEGHLRQALALLPPGHPWEAEARTALGTNLLAQGRYGREAWTLRGNRYGCAVARPKPHLWPQQEWDGGDLRGRRLLIIPDEGLGDQLQYARFAAWLRRTRGADVLLACHSPLRRLLAGTGVPVVDMAAFGCTGTPSGQLACPAGLLGPHDLWVLDSCIPERLGLGLLDIPNAPYVAPHGSRRRTPAGARIGIKTRGNPAHVNDRSRSLVWEDAAALRALPGAISLEPDETGARDFADTAAIIAGLDLVISVDTSVAHLAGAMGKPVWVLLPAHRTDWRWMQRTAASPWYPSARLYRQSTPGDWAPVLAAVARDVARLHPRDAPADAARVA